MSALALRVNGEPVQVAAGATIADLVAGITDEDEPQGGRRRRRPLRRPALGVGHAHRPVPGPWSRW